MPGQKNQKIPWRLVLVMVGRKVQNNLLKAKILQSVTIEQRRHPPNLLPQNPNLLLPQQKSHQDNRPSPSPTFLLDFPEPIPNPPVLRNPCDIWGWEVLGCGGRGVRRGYVIFYGFCFVFGDFWGKFGGLQKNIVGWILWGFFVNKRILLVKY